MCVLVIATTSIDCSSSIVNGGGSVAYVTAAELVFIALECIACLATTILYTLCSELLVFVWLSLKTSFFSPSQKTLSPMLTKLANHIEQTAGTDADNSPC